MQNLTNQQLIAVNERARIFYNLSLEEFYWRRVNEELEAGGEMAIIAGLMTEKVIDEIKSRN